MKLVARIKLTDKQLILNQLTMEYPGLVVVISQNELKIYKQLRG